MTASFARLALVLCLAQAHPSPQAPASLPVGPSPVPLGASLAPTGPAEATAQDYLQVQAGGLPEPVKDLWQLWQQNQLMRWRLNVVRASYGLAPLVVDNRLAAAAWDQCQSCFVLGKLTHTGRDGSSVWDRTKRFGWPGWAAGENAAWFPRGWVAVLPSDEQQVISGWMNSPAHRENMLGDWTSMGAAKSPDGRGGFFWILVFGR